MTFYTFLNSARSWCNFFYPDNRSCAGSASLLITSGENTLPGTALIATRVASLLLIVTNTSNVHYVKLRSTWQSTLSQIGADERWPKEHLLEQKNHNQRCTPEKKRLLMFRQLPRLKTHKNYMNQNLFLQRT